MSPRQTLPLVVPGGLAVLPAAAWLAAAPEHAVRALAAPAYAYAALGGVALLAWRFERSRVAAAAAALALATAAASPAAAGVSAHAAPLAAGLLAPVLAVLALMADRRLGAPRGLAQLLAAPLAAAAAALLLASRPGTVQAWLERTVAAPWAGGPELPGVVAAGVLAGFVVLAAVALRRGRALEAGLFWSALAGSLALGAPAGSQPRGVWMLAAALALGVALVEAAYALAFRDELTDLPGRRALRTALSSLRPPYSIAVVDVDRFKTFNDRYGHDVGDQVLRMVAAKLGAVGGGGRAFRSGGEEFTIVFPGLAGEEALPHLETVRRAVASSAFVLRRRPRPAKGAARRGRTAAGRRQLRVTVSIGLARCSGRDATPDDVVKSADRAMYRAKEKGRNRVVA